MNTYSPTSDPEIVARRPLVQPLTAEELISMFAAEGFTFFVRDNELGWRGPDQLPMHLISLLFEAGNYEKIKIAIAAQYK